MSRPVTRLTAFDRAESRGSTACSPWPRRSSGRTSRNRLRLAPCRAGCTPSSATNRSLPPTRRSSGVPGDPAGVQHLTVRISTGWPTTSKAGPGADHRSPDRQDHGRAVRIDRRYSQGTTLGAGVPAGAPGARAGGCAPAETGRRLFDHRRTRQHRPDTGRMPRRNRAGQAGADRAVILPSAQRLGEPPDSPWRRRRESQDPGAAEAGGLGAEVLVARAGCGGSRADAGGCRRHVRALRRAAWSHPRRRHTSAEAFSPVNQADEAAARSHFGPKADGLIDHRAARSRPAARFPPDAVEPVGGPRRVGVDAVCGRHAFMDVSRPARTRPTRCRGRRQLGLLVFPGGG